jgi:hypothetical protein
MLLVVAGAMFIGSCSEKKSPSDPGEFVFPTNFIYVLSFDSPNVRITGVSETINSVSLSINGTDVDLEHYIDEEYDEWYSMFTHTPGEPLNINLVINDNPPIQTTLKSVYPITNAIFPNEFNPSQNMDISWEIASNNEHQILYYWY